MELKISNVAFHGYDARPLKYIVMRNAFDIDLLPAAQQIEAIGKKHGFKMIFEGEDVFEKVPKDRTFTLCPQKEVNPWVQDKICVIKDKLLVLNNKDNDTRLHDFLGLKQEKIEPEKYVAGGNMYFIKNGKKEEILVGQNDCEKAMQLFPHAEIFEVPQADFHIDLFLRPLKDKKILVTDDNMTLKILSEALNNLKKSKIPDKKELIQKLIHRIKNMYDCIDRNPFSNMDAVINKLKQNGFEPIRVPGRIINNYNYSGESVQWENLLNYMNAIVHENPQGELVYISTFSKFIQNMGFSEKIAQEIGLDMEAHFKKALSEHIKPSNIHFIKGGKSYDSDISWLLKCRDGGIHCLSAEVPKEYFNAAKANPFEKPQRILYEGTDSDGFTKTEKERFMEAFEKWLKTSLED